MDEFTDTRLNNVKGLEKSRKPKCFARIY